MKTFDEFKFWFLRYIFIDHSIISSMAGYRTIIRYAYKAYLRGAKDAKRKVKQ